MAETLETAQEILTIRRKIEAIEGTQELLLRPVAAGVRKELFEEVFDKHKLLDEVYLAIDGSKSQAELLEALNEAGIEISHPTVSRRIGVLMEHRLVEEAEAGPRGVILRKKESIEGGLHLSRHLRDRQTNSG